MQTGGGKCANLGLCHNGRQQSCRWQSRPRGAACLLPRCVGAILGLPLEGCGGADAAPLTRRPTVLEKLASAASGIIGAPHPSASEPSTTDSMVEVAEHKKETAAAQQEQPERLGLREVHALLLRLRSALSECPATGVSL